MSSIQFNYADVVSISLPARNKVKEYILEIFRVEGKMVDKVNYIFCSDDYLLHINREFLSHDYYTDIITFNLSHSSFIVGEVYISVDRVKENAPVHHSSFKVEMVRVLFHGALHLCGYADKTKSELTLMRKKEEHYLRLFDFIK